ncbi:MULTISPECIES: TIGR02450 family Trp-rich protein [Chitinibacter]|uniref:TIGR02450 family Trp-rich protein n=1 Tax=Chitinibacter TaxID=230666 RepID=UPI00040B3C18|nr:MULTISPECIES: TIGR02450 family Trp-rich protein [Chitinibacter]
MPHPTRRWHPKKLLRSKWTAVQPKEKEKHFIVVRVETDPNNIQRMTDITLEAVFTRRHFTVHWSELSNTEHWKVGWV